MPSASVTGRPFEQVQRRTVAAAAEKPRPPVGGDHREHHEGRVRLRDDAPTSALDPIGPDILLFGASVFAKNGRDPRYVSWHQDSAYFGLSPHEEVTVWVAFTPANSVNGVLRVLPGSHTGPDMRHEETHAKDNMLAKGQALVGIDENKAVEMPLEPGEFSMHHERMAHSSLPNRSDDRRIGFAFFYIPAHVRSVTGRRQATVVRGVDRYGYWDPETLPTRDCDQASMAELAAVWGQYRDGEVKQAADSTD